MLAPHQGTISRLLDGDTEFTPILEVLGVNDVQSGSYSHCSLMLGDGEKYTECVLAPTATGPITSGKLECHSMIRLRQCFCSSVNDRKTLVILDLEVLDSDSKSLATDFPEQSAPAPAPTPPHEEEEDVSFDKPAPLRKTFSDSAISSRLQGVHPPWEGEEGDEEEIPTLRRTVSLIVGTRFRRVSSRIYMYALDPITEALRESSEFGPTPRKGTEENHRRWHILSARVPAVVNTAPLKEGGEQPVKKRSSFRFRNWRSGESIEQLVIAAAAAGMKVPVMKKRDSRGSSVSQVMEEKQGEGENSLSAPVDSTSTARRSFWRRSSKILRNTADSAKASMVEDEPSPPDYEASEQPNSDPPQPPPETEDIYDYLYDELVNPAPPPGDSKPKRRSRSFRLSFGRTRSKESSNPSPQNSDRSSPNASRGRRDKSPSVSPHSVGSRRDKSPLHSPHSSPRSSPRSGPRGSPRSARRCTPVALLATGEPGGPDLLTPSSARAVHPRLANNAGANLHKEIIGQKPVTRRRPSFGRLRKAKEPESH